MNSRQSNELENYKKWTTHYLNVLVERDRQINEMQAIIDAHRIEEIRLLREKVRTKDAKIRLLENQLSRYNKDV